MNLNELTELLGQSGADAWTVTDEKKHGWQFYFIRHRLDQNRVVNTEHFTVTVYRRSDDGKLLGSASEEIAPTAEEAEARKAIRELLNRAGYVQNPVYELRKPSAEENEKDAETTEAGTAADPAKISEGFIRLMTDLPETDTLDVNSYEIFTDRIEKRLVTSTGIDVTQTYPSSMLEVVTNAREKDRSREIELYRMYLSGTCDTEGLKKDISRVLQYGQDRLHTEPTPAVGKIPVVFSTADAVQIYNYFTDRLNAQMIYQKVSDWEVGKPAVGEVKGDQVTIMARRFLPNSSRNFVYDEEGAPIRDELLLENGIVRNYWGNAQYSSYLGLKNTFLVSNYEADGGSRSEEEIRSGQYLEIVEFSDFQVDAITGNVFGEIRLGYLHDGGQVKIVSGGSVSGSMRDYAKEMYCSRETAQYDNVRIPSVTKLMNVTVTGAAE